MIRKGERYRNSNVFDNDGLSMNISWRDCYPTSTYVINEIKIHYLAHNNNDNDNNNNNNYNTNDNNNNNNNDNDNDNDKEIKKEKKKERKKERMNE